MKILVTGAHGFIGSHFCRELRDADHEVIDTDLEDGDLLNPRIAHALAGSRPDLLVHLAAHVGREFGEMNGLRTVQENAAVTTNVARACAKWNVRLCYVSTSEVYGDGEGYAWKENDIGQAEPVNLYGLTKRWGEEVCRLYVPDGLTILRLSMPYGPGHPPGEGRAAITNFLDHAVDCKVIRVHRGAERSWCFVGDTVRAMRMVIESELGGAWNVGRDDNALPLFTVAQLACDLVGAPYSLIEEVEPPEWGQIVVKRLSTEKLRRLGFRPEVDLEAGMALTLEWLLSRRLEAA